MKFLKQIGGGRGGKGVALQKTRAIAALFLAAFTKNAAIADL